MSKWEWKEFEDCIERVKYTTKIPSKDYLQEGEFPIVSQEDCLISGYWNDRSDLFKVTKPIVIFGDHTKVLKYIDFDFVLGADGVKILCPKDYLNAHFFFYFLKSVNFDNLGYARHYRLLKELSVPIPPLSEQNRIVKFLDEEFSKIDTLKTNAETNLKNAKELFETTLEKELNPLSHHSERSEESSAELPSGWEWKTLDEFSTNLDAKRKPVTKKNRVNGNYPYYGASGIVDYVDSYIYDGKYLLISEDGANLVARSTPIAFIAEGKFWVNNHAHIIETMNEATLQYLVYFFENLDLSPYVKGMAQPKLSQDSLYKIQIPLPPLSVQKEIVARLDKLSENVKRLEANYKQIIANCDELKKSILKKTFERKS